MTIFFISFPFSSLFFTTTTNPPSTYLPTLSLKAISSNTLLLNDTSTQCKYVYPDPVPEFAQTETLKFRSELRKNLWTNKEFGDDLDKVVSVCEEVILFIISDFVIVYFPI
ncbi:hypothetical protein IFM89_017150 [Coptis chinensis]|uniref:Uncharacterized protein n=1 Tax=Coptis chinensis TaxID=261450 RepID=A0A835LZQ8_9MAGN|nr:hypothetical protein IFM89_017150 [Coptis chinensis]